MIQVIVRQTVLDRPACLLLQTLGNPSKSGLGPTVVPPVNPSGRTDDSSFGAGAWVLAARRPAGVPIHYRYGTLRGVQQFLENWGYLAIFVLTVLESACVPIPSEVTLGLGGALASGAVVGGTEGHLSLALVIIVGIVGSLVGSLLAYVVGRTGGRAFIDRYGKYVLLSRADLEKAESWFSNRGEWMVLYGRVIPFIRTFISLPAGIAEMNLARFITLTSIGVTVWVTLLTCIGYGLGSSWNSMVSAFGIAAYVAAAAAALLIAGFLIHRHRSERAKRSRQDAQPDPPTTTSTSSVNEASVTD
jgi:membrane protein DedA with SNARE-associated domain